MGHLAAVRDAQEGLMPTIGNTGVERNGDCHRHGCACRQRDSRLIQRVGDTAIAASDAQGERLRGASDVGQRDAARTILPGASRDVVEVDAHRVQSDRRIDGMPQILAARSRDQHIRLQVRAGRLLQHTLIGGVDNG